MTDWYIDAIKAKWNDPEVQRTILDLLDRIKDEPMDETTIIEMAVWGPRVEHACDSLVLPGAPECWGCGEDLVWKDGNIISGGRREDEEEEEVA